jgi:phosphate transport system substrate-binding protein
MPDTACIPTQQSSAAVWKLEKAVGQYVRFMRCEMTRKTCQMKNALAIALFLMALIVGGCGSMRYHASGRTVIQNIGSDTMVNLAQAWAEEYATVQPVVSVEVSGGGSGTGVAALLNGTADIANCSRPMEPDEIAKVKAATGLEPTLHIVGYDALAIFVRKDNPLEEITMEQLAAIYGENGRIRSWSDLGMQVADCRNNEMILVSRQSNSGTYFYFREAILGRTGDFKLGTLDLHGSKDVVELVSRTPCAIGYSGMGYATSRVKMLRVAHRAGEQAYAPTVENTQAGTYPISRPLYMYTVGQPNDAVKKYLEWVQAEAGQMLVLTSGYVPRNKEAGMSASGSQGGNGVNVK